MEKGKYNGWTNRETWNVALWINNTEQLYRMAVNFMKQNKGIINPYISFIEYNDMKNSRTGDGIKYMSDKLNYEELDWMMKDICN